MDIERENLEIDYVPSADPPLKDHSYSVLEPYRR